LQEFNAKKGMQTYGSSANRFQFNIRNVFTSSFNSSTGPNNGHPENPNDDSAWWDVLQLVLDIVGMVPGVGEYVDAASAGISMYRGDAEGAALSTAAMVPLGGWGPGLTKIAKDFLRILDKTGVTSWFKGLFNKKPNVVIDSPEYGGVVDDVVNKVDELPASEVLEESAKQSVKILEGAVADNYKRFVKDMPSNAKSSTIWKQLDDGSYLFEATSPATNIPGSYALYQKWVDAQGNTYKMLKTTFAPDGSIVHEKRKF
jgi:hypothetical protein